jgi:hypothetical protein
MVYRGSTLVESGLPTHDGRQVDEVVYLTRRAFMEITPDRNKFYIVTEEAAPEILGALAAGTVAGTKFTVAYYPHGGGTLVALLQTATDIAAGTAVVPNWPNVGDALPEGTDEYTSGTDIAAAAVGDALTIYAINADNKILGAWQKVLKAADIT